MTRKTKYEVGDIIYSDFSKIYALIEEITENRYIYMSLNDGKQCTGMIYDVDSYAYVNKVA